MRSPTRNNPNQSEEQEVITILSAALRDIRDHTLDPPHTVFSTKPRYAASLKTR